MIERLKNKAKADPKKIILPESEDLRILKAAELSLKEGIAIPVLLGRREIIEKIAYNHKISLNGIEIIEPTNSQNFDNYVLSYHKMRNIPLKVAKRIIQKPINFGLMSIKQGDADGMVAGVAHTTEEIIMSSELIIGMEKNMKTPSSFFLMHIPGYPGGENGHFLFADCALNPDPTPEQMADIAIATANSAKTLFNWEPRVAMLSFSTKGSASHPAVDKVVKAVEIVKKKATNLLVDGELQADAAIDPLVAQCKIKGESQVAGKANILIFPDLNSGNIAYKLVQRLAKAYAYGPFLQGFAKPVSDLSRGATVDDIVGTIALIVVKAQSDKISERSNDY